MALPDTLSIPLALGHTHPDKILMSLLNRPIIRGLVGVDE